MKNVLIAFLVILSQQIFAQKNNYWQQKIDYTMSIDVDEKSFQYDGNMQLVYTNNSPEVLHTVYFHLYFNAFQPGSAMDYRLTNIADPDSRMVKNEGTKEAPKLVSRIGELKPNQIGYQKIKSIQQNGKDLSFEVKGTILKVELAQPIQSKSSTTFKMEWQAQVPEQIRRSGRNNTEGVDFSMTQWYPKMAEFDEEGWHLDEYIGREFHAPFGDFDISIHIQKDYVVAASGKLQNPNEVKGYNKDAQIKSKKGKTTWHFKANNIHDFAWAADPEFIVDHKKGPNNLDLYFVYKDDKKIKENWKKVQEPTASFFDFMNKRFGEYPWSTYTVVQGGDGGMEYGTITLITGERKFESLAGVIFHEAAHSWFQHLFAFNETVNEWMDEGFTSYAEALGSDAVFNRNTNAKDLFAGTYQTYQNLVESGVEEPMSLLADYYNYNYAYGVEAYVKGKIYLIQLGYIIGDDNLNKTMLQFYKDWKLKHPTPNDFKRVAEKISGINLKWYNNLFINTTRFIDFEIKSVNNNNIELHNNSNFSMPIDLLVEYEDGSKELFYIPTLEMRGQKPIENLPIYKDVKRTVMPDWVWTNPTYNVPVKKEVNSAVIDPTNRLADINTTNNIYNNQ